MEVIKRSGRVVEWDSNRIYRAARAAIESVEGDVIFAHVVANNVTALFGYSGVPIGVERIQDEVERELMKVCPEAAKAFILYRESRNRLRRTHPDLDALSKYIHPAKYGRYIPELKRRETFAETVRRVELMHLKRFDDPIKVDRGWEDLSTRVTTLIGYERDGTRREVKVDDAFRIHHLQQPIRDYTQLMIQDAFTDVYEQRVLPSMRSMQFGGAAIEQHNSRMYNCSFTLVDRPEVFGQSFFLLLSGCGVGFSVQKQHVAKLPPIAKQSRQVFHYHIEDSIEGWGNAVTALVNSFVKGYYIEFAYDHIRPEGSPLKTSGGRAPGHIPLRECLEKLRVILRGAEGRQLRPIECHDMMCHIAEAVLAGGIRRSSLISLFSYDDDEMMRAKAPGNFSWDGLNTQRQMANNSAVLLRSEITPEQFDKIVRTSIDFWDPGFFLTNNLDHGINPCGEIGLDPVHEGQTGFAFCNLTEINGAKCKEPANLFRAAKSAAVIGTIQAAYCHFPYLGPVTEAIAKRDALIGVSITGMCDSPDICFNPDFLAEARAIVKEANEVTAKAIGINPAKRLCCIKPSGTASLELGGVASGIHPHHAKRYFRRVKANPLEPVYQHFVSINPHAVEVKSATEHLIVFPVLAPEGAEVDVPALTQLERVRLVKKHWIGDGELTHNVSCTVSMDREDIDDVIKWLYEHREDISAISFATRFNEKGIQHLPRQKVDGPVDEAMWKSLIENWKPVDYTKMVESEDGTNLLREPACLGGACNLE